MGDVVYSKYHDSEISKAEDFNFTAGAPVDILAAILDGAFTDVVNSFVISGLSVAQMAAPSMNVRVLPGLAFSRVENKILHTAYDVSAAVSAAHATMERLDTLEVRAVTQDIDAETRAFKDPATGAITYAGVNTKTKAFFEARCLPGTPGAGVAPNAETGWTKLAEVRVPAGATQIITSHIRNISAEEDAAENGTWTAQKAVTFNLGSVESIKNTLYAHTRSNVTANNTVHGIRQGHGNGLDADLLDNMQPASASTASTIMQRDSAGRAKVVAPAASDDIARKDTVDTHAALTGSSAHGAVSAATANQIIVRDAAGRAKVAAPAATDDIARKDTVDSAVSTHADLTGSSAHGAVSAATANQIIVRDANGRAQVAAPSADEDIARKDTVTAAVAAEATLARNADNLTSGTVPKARLSASDIRALFSDVTPNVKGILSVSDSGTVATLTKPLTLRSDGAGKAYLGVDGVADLLTMTTTLITSKVQHAVPSLKVDSEHLIRQTLIPGTSVYQLEAVKPSGDQMIFKVGPCDDWPDSDTTSYPKESTLTLYLSRKRWYDCYVDISLNRLSDPAKPKFVTFLRGDGLLVPMWQVQSRKDSGSYVTLLTLDAETGGKLVVGQGSVLCKMSESGAPGNISAVDATGPYYVDGATAGLPVAQSGLIRHSNNPYAASTRVQEYLSMSDPAHFWIRASSGGGLTTWRRVLVATDENQNYTIPGQLTLSKASGTAPMVISSTTRVDNLNADLLDGLHAGNANGNIAVSNGTVNTNLNADLLDGAHSSAFATAAQGAKADTLASAITVSSGKVGIGATPSYTLSVAGILGPGANTRSDGGYGGIDFTPGGVWPGYSYAAKIFTFRSPTEFFGFTNDFDGTGGQLAVIALGGHVRFFTGSATTGAVTIDGSSNMSIGTNDPAGYRLRVSGTILTGDANRLGDGSYQIPIYFYARGIRRTLYIGWDGPDGADPGSGTVRWGNG